MTLESASREGSRARGACSLTGEAHIERPISEDVYIRGLAVLSDVDSPFERECALVSYKVDYVMHVLTFRAVIA